MDVWPIRPNWREPFVTTYAFLTEIISSENGHEQRRAWRQTPRRAFEYLVSVRGDRFRSLMRTLAHKQGVLIEAPEWTRSAKIVASSAFGSKVFNVATLPTWVNVGKSVIVTYEDRIERRIVETVGVGSVTFEEDNTAAWPKGSKLSPAVSGRVDDNLSGTGHTRGIVETQIRFVVDPGSELAPEDLGEPDDTWNGREVYLGRANYANGADIQWQRDVRPVDYNFGRIAVYLPNTFTTDIRALDFIGAGRAQVQKIINLFLRMRGRQGEFYMPSDAPDLTLAGPSAAGSSSILVDGVDVFADYADDEVYKAISILLADGSRQYRTVTDLTLVGQNTRLDLDEPLTYAVSSSTVEVISWLPVCRFASDDLTVEWLHDELAKVRLSYQTILALEPETL